MTTSSTKIVAGKKRKWAEMTKADSDPSVVLHGKIHHYAKELRKAVKVAKRFEIQRLVKRLREARKGKENGKAKTDIVELESQLEILKKVDLEQIIGLALMSKIRKDRALSSNEVLRNTLTSFPFSIAQKSTEPQIEKVENRLLSSPVLASEVVTAVNGIRKNLYSDSKEQNVPSGAKDQLDQEEKGEDGDDWAGIVPQNSPANVFDQKMLSEDDMSGDENDKLIEAAGWESGSLDDDVDDSVEEETEKKVYVGGDVSMSSQSPKETRQPRKNKEQSQPENELGSQFLPSLSVGYVQGDSGSEFDSDEEPIQKRKNGRGQRARQLIWARKYGKNAKHIQKRQAAALSRNKLQDVKDGGTKTRRVNNGEPFNKDHMNNFTMPFRPLSRTNSTEARGALHPSWEAKRLLKSKENAQILPSQGKKIVFS